MSNTYPVALFLLRQRFKGSVRRRKEQVGEKPIYEWVVTGADAAECIRRLLPFLVEKKRQAELVLSIAKYPPQSEQRRIMEQDLRKAKRIRYD